MVLGRLLLLAVLPLAVSCQSGGSNAEPAGPVTRSGAENALRNVTLPTTRKALAEHFPGVSRAVDPPAFFLLVAKEPGDHEFCQLRGDLYLVMRVDHARKPEHRPLASPQNPVRRGNRTSSIVITPDPIEDVSMLKVSPNPLDVIRSAQVVTCKDDILLKAHRDYQEAEARAVAFRARALGRLD
jgi:hypothetical protein